jgi:hypothetical protein
VAVDEDHPRVGVIRRHEPVRDPLSHPLDISRGAEGCDFRLKLIDSLLKALVVGVSFNARATVAAALVTGADGVLHHSSFRGWGEGFLNDGRKPRRCVFVAANVELGLEFSQAILQPIRSVQPIKNAEPLHSPS